MSTYKIRPRFKQIGLSVGSIGKTVRSICYIYENRGTPEEDHHVLILYTDDTYAIAYKKRGDKCISGSEHNLKLSYDMFQDFVDTATRDAMFCLAETEDEAKQRRALEHLQSAAKELGYNLVKS